VTSTNLVGLLNCLELARRHQATFVFLSTSRVYPIHTLNALSVVETATRFELTDQQSVAGASAAGISEAFPLEGTRSLYGATKLAGELLAQEYFEMYGLAGVINRCGLLTGPWQMGRIDQGVVALWVARHVLKGRLQYFGYGGCGKQVRDILHIEDFYRLLSAQLDRIDGVRGGVFNVGGGPEGTVSLLELTALCEQSTGHRLRIDPVAESSPADIRVYVSDCRKVHRCTGWSPAIRPADIVQDLTAWVVDHRALLEPLFC
jgi:CDP-paratose 2-epimerase